MNWVGIGILKGGGGLFYGYDLPCGYKVYIALNWNFQVVAYDVLNDKGVITESCGSPYN